MKPNSASLAALVICVAATLPLTAAAGCSRATVAGADKMVPTGRVNQSLLDAAILSEVNYARCRHGLAKLTAEPRLRKQAEGHSRWMAKTQKVSHKSTVSGRASLADRLKRSGVKFRTGAENISRHQYYQLDGQPFKIRDAAACQFASYGGATLSPHSYQSLARMAVDYWMDSKGHRANILNRKARMLGSAASVNQRGQYCGTVFLAQNFVG